MYNGFENNLETFAKFVFWYELEIKSKRKSEKEIKDVLPKDQHEILNQLKKNLSLAKANSNSTKKFFTNEGEQLRLLKSPIIIGFCYHLRNAICHNGLLHCGDKMKIYDKNIQTKDEISGFVDYNITITFLEELVKAFENYQELSQEQ